MRKNINILLNVMMGGSIGIFIWSSVFCWLDYRKHPDFYAAQSAPWYTGIQIHALLLTAVLAVCLLLKHFNNRKK